MIDFNLRLSNPFWEWRQTDSINKWGKLTENKSWELTIANWGRSLIGFGFSWTFREAHAGITLELSLWKYDVYFSITDNRHWDYEAYKWEKYENN
jgi:hypothetical protein